MLQYVVAKDHVKGIVRKGDVMYVHFHLGKGRFDICRDVLQFGECFKALDKAMFWGHMEYLKGGCEKVGFLL